MAEQTLSDPAAMWSHIISTCRKARGKNNRGAEGEDKKSQNESLALEPLRNQGAKLQTKRGSGEGRGRTRFLWRKPSQTEAYLPAAPPLGTSMSHLSNPPMAPRPAIKLPLRTKVFP